jgi:hypothetical protein
MASRIGYDACFLAGLRNYRPDLGPAFRPRKIVYALSMTETAEAAPSFVVDITSVWDTKMRHRPRRAQTWWSSPSNPR